MLQSLFMALEERVNRAGTRLLTRPVAAYELKVPNSMGRLYRHIRRGDVVLVEGELRISQLVKYVSQSQWSHSALYVGDELLRRGGQLREQALANFGELADRLIVEALPDEGVIAAPLDADPYRLPLNMRHYSQILPRDFDLSPYFQIIKFNIGEEGPFDYKHLTWKNSGTTLPVASRGVTGNGNIEPDVRVPVR